MTIRSTPYPLRYMLAVVALSAPLAVMAQPGHDRNDHGNDHQDQHQQQRPQQTHRQDSHAQAPRGNDHNYAFRQQDRAHLQSHYKRLLGHVDRAHRPHFEAGQRLPPQYRGAITRAPESLRRRLPPPPAGYEIGYYQGYTIVYDPTTLAILTVIDLLNQ